MPALLDGVGIKTADLEAVSGASKLGSPTERSRQQMMRRLYACFQQRFQPERVRLFYETFDITEDTKVVDLGGGTFFWQLAQAQGRPVPRVTILNIRPVTGPLSPCVAAVIGDAKAAPFDDFSFDIAFSNSLIEHLFDWGSQCVFADEVRRLAPNYFVQTPDKHFPVEPHFATPFIHWLPKSLRRQMIRNFTVWGLLNRPSRQNVESAVAEIKLLGPLEISGLFPEAVLKRETFMGLSKSIVAYRRQSTSVPTVKECQSAHQTL
ncbi:MAG: class I SAM-dependent methyltransferase [Candidatus Sulfotelmatobacter sp.]